MRVTIAFIFLFLSFGCQGLYNPCGSGKWQLDDTRANFALLQVNFVDYIFEGGIIQTYELCDSCDIDSIPVKMIYVSPGDFGSIMFQYTESLNTIFHGSIVWDGRGERIIPSTLLSPDCFSTLISIALQPLSITYYPVPPFSMTEYWITKADSALLSISSLDITNKFAESDYRIGIFLYPRSVGMFSPSDADWIIILLIIALAQQK